jgi:hypothetical protein
VVCVVNVSSALVAFLAEVVVKALLALVAATNNGGGLAPVTYDAWVHTLVIIDVPLCRSFDQ